MKWELVGRLGFPTECLPHWLAALIALQLLESLTASLLRATFDGARLSQSCACDWRLVSRQILLSLA